MGAQKRWPDFEKGWRRALHDGLIGGTASPQKEAKVRVQDLQSKISNSKFETASESLELNFRPDPSLLDGRFANNGWLQECPRPISKLTWDNALLISAALAQKERLADGDVVELKAKGRSLRLPILIVPGQARTALTVHLGYGRSRAGQAGDAVGFDAFTIRPSDSPWTIQGAQLVRTGLKHQLVTTQTHHNLESPERVYRETLLSDLRSNREVIEKSVEKPERDETLFYPEDYENTRVTSGACPSISHLHRLQRLRGRLPGRE